MNGLASADENYSERQLLELESSGSPSSTKTADDPMRSKLLAAPPVGVKEICRGLRCQTASAQAGVG